MMTTRGVNDPVMRERLTFIIIHARLIHVSGDARRACAAQWTRDGSEVRANKPISRDDGEQSHTRKQTTLNDDNVVTAAGGRTRSSDGGDSFSEKSSAANDRDSEWCVCV